MSKAARALGCSKESVQVSHSRFWPLEFFGWAWWLGAFWSVFFRVACEKAGVFWVEAEIGGLTMLDARANEDLWDIAVLFGWFVEVVNSPMFSYEGRFWL